MQALHLVMTLASCAAAARILAVLPSSSRSHHLFHQPVLKALASRGHQVVVYGPFPLLEPVPNYTNVLVNVTDLHELVTYEMVLDVLAVPHILMYHLMWEHNLQRLEEILRDESIQKLARSEDNFDLVLTETFDFHEVLLIFGYKFKAPVIALQPLQTYSAINKVMGNSLSLSNIPEVTMPFSDQMTLFERIINCFAVMSNLLAYYYQILPHQQSLLDRHFNFPNAPTLEEMVHNVSLVLLNAHPTTSYARPLTPNVIPIGGIHVSSEKTALPQLIQKFMDEAPQGVIYISFGTLAPEHRFPPELNQMFVRVFKRLKQRVLWKTRAADNITGLSENVITMKWAPQQDILGHPNCVLFITQGGLLSQLEVLHAGVPVVGVPIYADQAMNVRYYEHKGVGVKLDFLAMSEESVLDAINTVIKNPRYKGNAVALSQMFRDLPMAQAESAVYWVEYVLRHKGAPHLRPTSARMSWYQLTLLDVLAVILLVLGLISVSVFLICRRIWRKISNTPSKKELSTKKLA